MDEEHNEIIDGSAEAPAERTIPTLIPEEDRIEFPTEPVTVYKVSTGLSGADMKALKNAGYDNAEGTMKSNSKIDPFVLVCGLFAVACLGVSVYNAVKNGFDLTIGILMCCYVLVAVFCLVKPVQRLSGRLFYGIGFPGKLKLNAPEKEATFDDVSVSFELDGKERTLYYENMFTGYETDDCFVFHIDDKMIVPVPKKNVEAAAEDGTAGDALAFFEKCISKANKTAPEEEVPQITRGI